MPLIIQLEASATDGSKNMQRLHVHLNATFSDEYCKDHQRLRRFENELYAQIDKLLDMYFDSSKINYPDETN